MKVCQLLAKMAITGSGHWAVLIGVEFYTSEKPVRGAITDVQLMKAFLESNLPSVNISVFTASKPTQESSPYPPEKSHQLPTVSNITAALGRVTSLAQAGDTVYIHYSGHGTKRGTPYVFLALYENDSLGYLSGLRLSKILEQMGAAGLRVTLILDCCFSGSVRRHDDQEDHDDQEEFVRGFEFNPAVHPPLPDLNESTAVNEPEQGLDPLRDSRLVTNWLVNPNGYTALCACTPWEICKEISVGGVIHGPLSYFLHRALVYLCKASVEVNHRSVYGHISARFHAEWPVQNPMRYGNKNFSIFGKLLPAPHWTSIPVFWRKRDGQNQLYLQNGQAHGVQKGDEYEIYPVEEAESAHTRDPGTLCMVRSVDALTSELQSSGVSFSISHIKSGWKAKAHTQISLQNFAVRLRISNANMDEWAAAIAGKRFVALSDANAEGQPSSLSIVLNNFQEYQVVDDSGTGRATLPTIKRDQERSIHLILDIVEHVGTYRFIEALENRQPHHLFAGYLKVQVFVSGEDRTMDISNLKVKHDEELCFRVENMSIRAAYLHIYNLGIRWQIESLIDVDGGGDFLGIPAGSAIEVKVTMTVPDELASRGQTECTDVLKFFITSSTTSFAVLELSGISKPAEALGNNLRHSKYSQLSELLSALRTPNRGEAYAELDDWIAMNFIVTTIRAQ